MVDFQWVDADERPTGAYGVDRGFGFIPGKPMGNYNGEKKGYNFGEGPCGYGYYLDWL